MPKKLMLIAATRNVFLLFFLLQPDFNQVHFFAVNLKWDIAERKKSLHLKLHHELLVQNE